MSNGCNIVRGRERARAGHECCAPPLKRGSRRGGGRFVRKRCTHGELNNCSLRVLCKPQPLVSGFIGNCAQCGVPAHPLSRLLQDGRRPFSLCLVTFAPGYLAI
jgi:hypothetical protein